jgi:hypothetical protein
MVKRQKVPTRSMGSEGEDPDIQRLAAWVSERRGVPGDLTTYLLERSLLPQGDIDTPCAGGEFYRTRWLACIEGITGEVITGELDSAPAEVILDAVRITSLRKGAWAAIPAPSLLGITDRYYDDPDEVYLGLTRAYTRLMREMRDAGIRGHVLVAGEGLNAIELERLSGYLAFFYLREPGKEQLSLLLEYQQQVALPPALLPRLLKLREEYDIQKVILMDPEQGDLEAATEQFDQGEILSGGYCRGECDTYWSALAERAYVIR